MVTVRTATVHDAEIVGRIMAAAFRDDPAWSLFLPREATREARLADYYRGQVRRRPGRVDVAEDDGRVVGAALWDPPVTDRRRRRPLRDLATAGTTLLRRAVSARLRRALDHNRAVEAMRPPQPHWYLRDIGADPAARGRGIGSALIRHRLDLIDREDPAPVFLESTTAGSRRLYERFGFEALGTTATARGNRSTAMLRPSGGSP